MVFIATPGCDMMNISQSSRCAFSTWRSDPDMRRCNTVEDLVQVAYDHLVTISLRGIAAFWSLFVKHLHNHYETSQCKLIEQLNAILYNTLENMSGCGYIDIATIATSLVKVMKQVESRGQRATTGSLHRILHNLLVGIHSEKKQFILDKVAKLSLPILSEFDARSLSNLIYSFGHAEYIPMVEDERTILDILAVEAMSKLQYFNSQDLSNMLWSYAKLESSNLLLFKAAGDSIVGMNDLNRFHPQALSNIMWSHATAGESHPQLFCKFANHIVAMKDLGQFKPQELSNIVWAFATAGESHPQLYRKFADHIVAMKDLRHFKPQELSNLLWAYATVGIIDLHLFTSFAPAVSSVLGQCNSQNVANIAWAYAVANVNEPLLFNSDFFNTLQANVDRFVREDLFQLHQWQLWQDELKSGINLPRALRDKCCQAFDLQLPQPSRLQDDVIFELSSIGMSLEEEFLTSSGYRLDALVEVNGEKVGIEVDGPLHFINREATGSTILKRRQVNKMDDICIVSVPYWDWDKLGTDRTKKQMYLRCKLGWIAEQKKRFPRSDLTTSLHLAGSFKSPAALSWSGPYRERIK